MPKIANFKTIVESKRFNGRGVGTMDAAGLAVQKAAAHGIHLAADGRACVKVLPNKKGFRIVNGEYVPRKQK